MDSTLWVQKVVVKIFMKEKYDLLKMCLKLVAQNTISSWGHFVADEFVTR